MHIKFTITLRLVMKDRSKGMVLTREIGFPNTAYYLPIIYAITGIGVSKIKDIRKVLDICKRLIPPL